MPSSHAATDSSPHPSRSSTPRPPTQGPSDHTVSFRHKLSLREYPPDCPPLNVRWFYAVDVPKRKPFPPQDPTSKPPKPPSKFVPFGARDSRAIEAAFQKLSEEEDAAESNARSGERRDPREISGDTKVPVNEDYLFDVDVKNRELAPVYWLGPVYDVRRGTWFFQEGGTLKPCDENLATQIEEGYLRLKPFRQPPPADPPKPPPSTTKLEDTPPSSSGSIFSRQSANPLKEPLSKTPPPQPQQQQSWRLFGAHLNSFVVFVDTSTAWLLTDDFYGKLSSTVFQRISAGSHMGGTKLVRGYSESLKAPEKKSSEKEQEKEKEKPDGAPARPVTPNPPSSEKIPVPKRNRMSMPPPSTATQDEELEVSKIALERKISSLSTTPTPEDQDVQMENEMKEDYRADEAIDDPGREIEHLLLVTHGIGQKLSMRMESVNFVHDVNVFRKSLKSVYGVSPDLQGLNGEGGDGKASGRRNCRIQCLPVCWRHLLDFPHHSRRATKSNELDLSSGFSYSNDEYPSLADITVEGVPAVRSLMTDLALDVLLYQSAIYREHIAEIVRAECNRIYRLFRARNPEFKGKVSLVGHSLGSAILFDILCRQPDGAATTDEGLEFDVDNLFCLGSPIGLFEMLKGRTIAARPTSTFPPTPLPNSVSAPKCQQLFNIFHPTDPISYRLEPLVSTAMAELKPQPLPYTKRSIFGATPLVGISGIGQSVTRSVTGLWSSLSSGVASAILNRSLGFDSGGPPTTSTEKKDPGAVTLGEDEMAPTEIETLYAKFQKRREVGGEEFEDEAWRLRKEEEKVRELNETGRIDFAIQEGVFDISLLASIASHLSYWADEDVNHFVISQLLARRVRKKKKFGPFGQ